MRQKFRTGNATFQHIVGAVARKQIPLCKYHHISLHKGNLNHADIQKIVRYRKNFPKSMFVTKTDPDKS